jgi:hypothetical protein
MIENSRVSGQVCQLIWNIPVCSPELDLVRHQSSAAWLVLGDQYNVAFCDCGAENRSPVFAFVCLLLAHDLSTFAKIAIKPV